MKCPYCDSPACGKGIVFASATCGSKVVGGRVVRSIACKQIADLHTIIRVARKNHVAPQLPSYLEK
jgi:hypothetical protein